MSLDVQVQILSVDTGNFYSNREASLHWLIHKLSIERVELKNEEANILKLLAENGVNEDGVGLILKGLYDFSIHQDKEEIVAELGYKYCKIKEFIKDKNSKIKEAKTNFKQMLSNKTNENIATGGKHHIRELRNIDPELRNVNTENKKKKKKKDVFKYVNEPFNDKSIISVFDSAFTRMIGAKQDELTEDFMVVQVYYFDIIKDLIYHGFTYKGEKYIYFTSSAGQIRTKKTVFVKESVWKKYEKTIMCGLTVDSINVKGGNNPNKHLAYMALTNSATDVWKEFDIDKTIVVNDFATDVFGTYDLVDDADYSIKRMTDYVPIEHTDGAGMMLPCMGKNRMVRLPWVKGLLGSFDYVQFIKEHNCSPVIKDIYGKEHDVIAEDIQIIFTKSQFKMYKYYDSWEQYKEYYKLYNCSAGYTNMEEDKIKNATINYQMLQTLTDITDKEIDRIIKKSQDKLQNICTLNGMKDAFGITPYNNNLTPLQQAINLYPTLLNDEYIKATLREIKDSMVQRYRAGSLAIHGKYTFILPDLYAACQHWFMGIENPKGLLDDGEVFCWLFKKNEKLDCLRSPHLYKEHAVRKNVACAYDKNNIDEEKKRRQEEVRRWFGTDAIYTSCHDLISKILQFDVDGDKSLVVADENIVPIAERNMQNIVPLYYNMKKASPIQLNNQTIYDGLNAAFSGGNIGTYSNNISKIWNSEIFVSGSEKEKQAAIDLIKLLCMENNFVIDYAKTLYKPERPKNIHDEIAAFTKGNVPHFFVYAKDKKDTQVENVNNSIVNKLESKIKNPRINCRDLKDSKGKKLGVIDYTKLVRDQDIECRVVFNKNGTINVDKTDPLIVKYCELNQEYHFKVNGECVDMPRDAITNTQMKHDLYFKKIGSDIKSELSKFGYTDSEVADILVKFLYHVKPSKHKAVLWFCYGRYIVENLKKNNCKPETKAIQCVDCGEWFETSIFDSAKDRCEKCYGEYIKAYDRDRKSENLHQIEFKTIVCCDCGKEFEVGIKNTRAKMCTDCYAKHRRYKKTETMRNLRSV